MNKKSVTIAFGVAVIAVIIFWSRLGSLNNHPASQSSTMMPASSAPAASGPVLPKKDPSEYNAMMGELAQSMASWPSLNPEDQRLAVAAVIQLLGQQRGKISRPPAYYADRINQTLQTSKEILGMSLDRVVVIFAVMDYDFENGQDKDLLAQEILGPSMYAANKARRQQMGLS